MPFVNEIDVRRHRNPEHGVEPIFWQRWSPRAMSGEKIREDELLAMFEAARWAPSSYNEQPWRFLYARRDTPHWNDYFSLLSPANQSWCGKAGVLALILSKKTFSHNGSPNTVSVFDAGSAWQNLALKGASLGLVVHGMAGYDSARARQVLQVPDEFDTCAMFAIGRPGRVEDLPAALAERETPSPRKPIAEIAFEGRLA